MRPDRFSSRDARVERSKCDGPVSVSPPVTRWYLYTITFRVSRRRREMYCGHALLCLSAATCPHYCTDPDVSWGSGRGCPVVVHYWADLKSVHGLRCYGNIARTRNVSEYVLVLALCLVCPASVCAVCLPTLAMRQTSRRSQTGRRSRTDRRPGVYSGAMPAVRRTMES